MDSKLISADCTSMAITSDFIMFTTTSPDLFHKLFVFHWTDPYISLQYNKDGKPILLPNVSEKSQNVRNVERGSVIISVLNEKVVL